MTGNDSTEKKQGDTTNRREFLRSMLRVSALGALAAGTYKLAVEKSSNNEHTCIADGICARCGKSSDCKLPQAMSYRTVRRQKQ